MLQREQKPAPVAAGLPVMGAAAVRAVQRDLVLGPGGFFAGLRGLSFAADEGCSGRIDLHKQRGVRAGFTALGVPSEDHSPTCADDSLSRPRVPGLVGALSAEVDGGADVASGHDFAHDVDLPSDCSSSSG